MLPAPELRHYTPRDVFTTFIQGDVSFEAPIIVHKKGEEA
jgi:hypothetical protein